MDLDLAIVGGGPAGVATALFLVAAAPRLRDRIAIFEKERYPREKICAGAVGGRADRLLASIGVRVDVPSAPVRGLSVLTSRGHLAVRDARTAPAVGRVVRRVEFDRVFADQARARGIRVVEGARVTELHTGRDSVLLRTEAGDVRARAVVGADGVGSTIRRALGAPRGRWLAQVVEVDTPLHAADPPRDVLHFDLSDGSLLGYGWDFPTLVGGEPLVCRGLYELRPAPGLLEPPGAPVDVAERLRARLRRLGLPDDLRVKRFAERGLSLHEPLARPRALLVGEAAGVDPVLGEGIAQAIFYGAAAGPYLARCLARDELSFHDWPGALRVSRVGLDLGIRGRATPLVYGASRSILEAWVARSPALARAGMRYFAGDPVPRSALALALADLGRTVIAARLRTACR